MGWVQLLHPTGGRGWSGVTAADRAIEILERIEEIRITRLRSGDVVLIKVPPDLEDVDLVAMLSTVQHWFPHNDVRILAGIDVEIVRPEERETDG